MNSTNRAVAQRDLHDDFEDLLGTSTNLVAADDDDDDLLGTIPLKGALDAPIKATFFKDVQAFERQERPMSLRQLEHKIRETKAKHKNGLPLIKLATFGNKLSPKADGSFGKCLRHDGNMLKVSGIEGDYDAGEMPMAQAAELLRQAGVAALFYTSTHHTPEAPRWRVLCPLAMEVTPEERAALCARLNGILGGILADESFTPSQAYYFGEAAMRDEKKGGGNAHPLETMLLEGKPLDQVKGPQRWAGGSDKPAEDRAQNDDERAPLGVTAQRVAEWLEHLPNADVPYETKDGISWNRVMLAVRHECQGRPAQERAQFLEAFQNWSRKSEKHDDKEAAKEWRKRSEGQGKVITASWLEGQAKAHGWIDESEFEDYGDEEVGQPVPAKSKKNVSKSFTFEWFHEAELPEASPFLVEDLLDQGTASVVYGPSNAGKTFFTLDLCFALATAHKGATWQGRGIEKTAVLYLALEGGGKFTMRLKALQTAYGDDGKIPFAYRQGGANLLHKDDKGDVKGIVAMANAMQRDAVAQGLPLMIVIDTLSRALSGGDENAPTDMTAFVGNVDRIREDTGAHVMVVHHTGKDIAKGMRGHSSLVAAIDTEIEVIRPDGKNVVQVTVGKQRDHKSDYPFGNFQIKEVTLGTDNRGKEMTSAVADWGVSQERVKAAKFTKPQQLVMDIFQEISGGEPVEREAIIAACLGREVSKAKDPKDRRKGVMSILGALVNNNALSESDGLYRIYSPEDDLWFDDLGDEPVGGTGEQGGIQREHSPSGNASGGGRNGTRSIERSLFPHDVGEGVL